MLLMMCNDDDDDDVRSILYLLGVFSREYLVLLIIVFELMCVLCEYY
jgi:hypothetical protein